LSLIRELITIFAAFGFAALPIQADAQRSSAPRSGAMVMPFRGGGPLVGSTQKSVRSKPHVKTGRSSHPDFLWAPTGVKHGVIRMGTSPSRRMKCPTGRTATGGGCYVIDHDF
jgi:hypothetical protein